MFAMMFAQIRDARKKMAPDLCARQRPRALCFSLFVQDRGDRTRVAAMREAASHVERERKGEQHMEFHGGLPPKY